jgi:NAD(P)-dependent dehydrogenase (short-subunit alcohol dehydrogenase family)
MSRTALITGGTGGLGRAVVGAFVGNGWRVVVPDVAPAELDGAEVVEADLTDAGQVAGVVERAATREDAPLRAVVNLVGGFAADQPVAATPLDVFEAQFALNLRPTYLVTQAALPALVAAGGGSIVCMSSRSALHPFAGASG